jgi:hypothetical protein
MTSNEFTQKVSLLEILVSIDHLPSDQQIAGGLGVV